MANVVALATKNSGLFGTAAKLARMVPVPYSALTTSTPRSPIIS